MAAEVKMNEIPEDMVIEILSRLPVKSLMRLRCVCKSWSRLFTNKDFIAKHHDNQIALSKSYIIGKHGYRNRACFSILSSEGGDESFVIEETIHARYLKTAFTVDMLGPVNGLIALIPIHDYTNRITIWNPATRQFKLAYHPDPMMRYRGDIFGFGFDRKSNDYKIVRFDSYKVIADLYSLNNDCWREIDSPKIGFDLHKLESHRVNAWLYYWWVDGGDDEFLLSFNFEDEVFEKLFLPTSLRAYPRYGYNKHITLITNFNKLLTIMVDNFEGSKKYIDVWVMSEYGVNKSWVNQMRLGPFETTIKALGFSKYGRLLLQKGKRTKRRPSSLILWDPITGQPRDLHLRRHERKFICEENPTQVVNYVESLVQLNGQREDEDESFVRTRSLEEFELYLQSCE